MITPELLAYIRTEFAKGRKREEIHAELESGGGWREVDLNEAFRTVIPMESFVAPNPTPSNTSLEGKIQKSNTRSSKKIIENLIFIIIGVACVCAWYFYRTEIANFWNRGVDTISEFSSSLFRPKPAVEITSNPLPNNAHTVSVTDCGVTVAPDMQNSSSYNNDVVLNCLGRSALLCEEAKGVLKNNLLPSEFRVFKDSDDPSTCLFQLSYDGDSKLMDIHGTGLASEGISCPISIVKAVDESKNPTIFNAPSKDNPSKYASQIYFYGTLGVFMENNVNKTKIQSLGCRGFFIDAMIASYQKTQSQ